MKQNGEYGDQILMRALALKFGSNFTIHKLIADDKLSEDTLIFNEPKEDFQMVHVSYHLNNHYNSVVSLDEKTREKVEKRKVNLKSSVYTKNEQAV